MDEIIDLLTFCALLLCGIANDPLNCDQRLMVQMSCFRTPTAEMRPQPRTCQRPKSGLTLFDLKGVPGGRVSGRAERLPANSSNLIRVIPAEGLG